MSYKLQRKIIISAFLFVPLLFMAAFLFYPTVRMVFYSFTDWDGVLPTYHMVGFANFKRVFTEPLVWLSLKNNAVYALFGIAQNVVALFFAVMLTSRMRGKNVYKTIAFLPYILNITAVAYMFNFLFDYRNGPINDFMRYLAWSPIKFFSDEHLVIFSLASISMWKWLGYTMILYIAALQSMDSDMIEAAKIDGATNWQIFMKITLPNIRRIVELNMFLAISGALQAFTEPLIMTHGGPNQASYTFLYYIIQTYTTFNEYGFAAAMTCTLILIIFVITFLQRKILLRGNRTA
ncbi:ABC transporter permease [Paenibacillus pectinilyticus]|uniref:ABC transporter permease n=1 Tax=Paenibacillus pectinilyticus TaxID=512399 RepID=A0A1C0ZUP4_9BACL|nr:sugar ABC transporter permease [Paenibacillus pectinilyticus]OCT11825.1 ABC transporter permease [Paenibacillus pectinilyticus]